MSFQDLADAVRIRKASVHYQFPTKSDLLMALIDGHEASYRTDQEHPAHELQRYAS